MTQQHRWWPLADDDEFPLAFAILFEPELDQLRLLDLDNDGARVDLLIDGMLAKPDFAALFRAYVRRHHGRSAWGD